MFLAWNEMKNNKLRFSLIVGVLSLVSYLVFFLSGLANGLENLNKESVLKWDADGIILTEESDRSLPQSIMETGDYNGNGAEEYAILGQFYAIASTGDAKGNVSLFGIREDEFIMPEVTEGKPFRKMGEVIADDTLKDEGFKIGDVLTLSATEEKLKITGFTDHARFNAAPVLYGSMETLRKVRFGESAERMKEKINAFVVRSNNLSDIQVADGLDIVATQEFIENMPGYSEQNMTLTFMIYFLFIISAVILAIFLYVLTIQKISIFGVMKAQGISSGYLSKSVIAQTFLLAVAGVIIGLALTVLTGLFLPPAVPVAFNYLDMLVYAIVLIGVSIVGALFSVQTIAKIDPLKAIGG
ncbi:peptide ABC transporter permease [Bacillus sp. FJAT-27225]|uniref:ABC transporter permease n=1 Tax=Bacillus sp. FJAT-27225 TaxID=1743144 RepID=UPI00080C3359|nr:ABC transporter permease [Bacillus sp. FJAT-27225]OCA85742.1 peptide ABC transporter permease [Bacillus sp. FJAT-27225]